MTTARLKMPPKLIPVFQGSARYRGAHGGRGSGKTFSFAKMTAVDAYRLAEAGVSGVILCGREHLNSLEESSMEEVKAAIRSEPFLDDYFEIGEKFVRTRNRLINYTFTGLRHNLDGLKSKARILRAWVDEGENVSEAAWGKLIPTVRAEGGSADNRWQSEIWVTWNPESPDSATHRRFRENPPADAKIVELNWRDNPWFPEVLEAERLEDAQKRPDTYEHIWEGAHLVLTEAQVFKDLFEMSEFTPEADWDGPYHGLDFGFSQDPTAGNAMYIHDNCLYIRHELHRKKLEIDDIPQALVTAIPRSAMHALRCDSARPETISYLQGHGLPLATGVKKGRGSVEDGVEYIKQFDRVYIHPECPETYREFQKYSYKVDRLSGDVLPILLDADNHHIDAIRYALEPMIRSKSAPRILQL